MVLSMAPMVEFWNDTSRVGTEASGNRPRRHLPATRRCPREALRDNLSSLTVVGAQRPRVDDGSPEGP